MNSAWRDKLCTNGFGWENMGNVPNQPKFRSFLFAHELGHNFGLQHTKEFYNHNSNKYMWIMKSGQASNPKPHIFSINETLPKLKQALTKYRNNGCI